MAQADVVPEVVRLVAVCGVDVGLILGGSVGEGIERPDSDLDFFAIADADTQPSLPGFSSVSEKNGSKVLERQGSEFPIHVACWTTASLDEVIRRRPYMVYPLLRGRIVFDSVGIARWYRTCIREYFTAHPGIARRGGNNSTYAAPEAASPKVSPSPSGAISSATLRRPFSEGIVEGPPRFTDWRQNRNMT